MVRPVLLGFGAVGVLGVGLLAYIFATSPNGDIRWALPMRAFVMPSESMSPTIETGDHFVAVRASAASVKRGDVLLYRNGRDAWVKRVAALPGDTIAMSAGIVMLNGKPVAQRPAGHGPISPEGEASEQYAERFEGEAAPHRILDMGERPADDTDPVRVPARHLFVLGDNRDNSVDSRFPHDVMTQGGLVSFDDVYGIVSLSK